ncbi:MAG: tRNA preQ1(34) S-adenosylmethionine ribosyltransferase-isomerase QueA [Anaeroplasmataceae bacterium]
MKTDDFDYYLDENLIAQTPLENRSESKMLILDKKTGELEDKKFSNIVDYINEGDCLVLNDTKVIPARLIGLKQTTNAVIEILILDDTNGIYKTLVKPARRIKINDKIIFGEGILVATCVNEEDEGIKYFKFDYDGIFLEILDKLGDMPLPPYIYERLEEKDRYQTIYAKNPGSSAAPTAGLHFTKEILTTLENKGVKICYVTLHVGLGTFRPVKVDNVLEHVMHSEYYEISEKSANILNDTFKSGNKIISVGTTCTRVLETAYNDGFKQSKGHTNIFIYPGYQFKCVDIQITNFHLPKSTLIMLVSAFSSKKIIMNAYEHAVKNKYRFFSFGDCMLIK